MKKFDIRDDEGRLKSFEVGSGIGRRRVSRLIEDIPGVKVIRVTSGFSWNIVVPRREETVCEFEIAGIAFQISEDWGDSSRYWIGPQDHGIHPETEIVKEVFARAKKSWW